MCGIVAVFDFKDEPTELRARVLSAARQLRHRGPDWSGIDVGPGAILAHERLAIVDPLSGSQPLRSDDGRWVVAANGEIYNHMALRKQHADWTFRTGSDCEVLLPLYAEKGAEMLDALHNGAHVVDISVDGKSNDTCLVKDLQFGWLGDNLIHLDMTRVDMNEVVTINLPVTLVGNAKIASAAGAVLEVIRREIEVTCKVSDIPGELKYDITEMGEVVTIGDLPLPEGVTPVLELEKHICHVTFMQDEEAEGEATDVDADDAQPEVITKAKEDGEDASDEG